MLTRAGLTSLPGLAPVDEEATSERKTVVAQEDGTLPDIADEDVEQLRRQSGASVNSAKTTFSQEEIAELDRDVMVDVLPNLASATDELIKLLAPADPQARTVMWDEIQAVNSKYSKLYSARLASLLVHKGNFGSQEYIQPGIILRALLNVPTLDAIPTGPWRPDSILYKVNLVQMLIIAVIKQWSPNDDTDDNYNSLELLEASFPVALAGPGYDATALGACLAIQAQLAIARLNIHAQNDDYNIGQIITDIFFESGEGGALDYKYSKELRLQEAEQELQFRNVELIQKLANDLRITFEAPGTLGERLASLTAKYPWHQSVAQIMKFFNIRKIQLDTQIAAAGGVGMICQGLSDEVQRREDATTAGVKRLSLNQPTGTPSFDKKSMTALKARMSRQSEGVTAFQAPAPVAQMMAPEYGQPPDFAQDGFVHDNDDADYNGHPQSEDAQLHAAVATLQGFQTQQHQRANQQKGKQRANFIDPQPGAHRVQFEDSQYTHTLAAASRDALKRGHPSSDDFEPTQDTGFEPAAPMSRRKSGAVPRKRVKKNPGSSIPAPPAPLDPEDDNALPPSSDYNRAKILAKRSRLMASQNKPPQIRTSFTDGEEAAVIELIESNCDEGISWAALKRIDEALPVDDQRLGRRSAEDIRFKARNMKFTYLKYVALPRPLPL